MMMGKEFSDRLKRILDKDSNVLFVKLLRNHPTEITNSLVEMCAKFGARKCLLALLNGELCHCDALPALDAHSPNSDVTALAYVAHCCPDAQIIDLMLMRCNAIPLVNVSCTIASIHGLPIHFILLHLSYLEHLYPWAQGDSLIKLIILLCQWRTKPILDSARLLAKYTDSINDIAWTFVKQGALKQFGALLLVAQDKVMAPFDTGLTIRQCLISEIDSLSEGDIANEQATYKNMLIDAKHLLDVFERAGGALSLYCNSMQKYVAIKDAVAYVCELLKTFEVHVCKYDLIFYYLFKGYRGLSRINILKLEAPSDSRTENWLHVQPAERYNPKFEHAMYIPKIKPTWERSHVSSAFQPRFMSTSAACHIKKMSKPLEHAHANSLLEHSAYITMKLKKGLRFL